MFARMTVLAQIMAIVACPIWCGNGMCHAVQQCSAKSDSTAEPASCCEGSATTGEDSKRNPSPFPTTSCQGICGGAVFERPIELDAVSGSFWPSLIAVPTSDAPQLTECQSIDFEGHWHWQRANVGRALRNLYMSLTC